MPDELKHMELMDTAAASSGVPPAEPSGNKAPFLSTRWMIRSTRRGARRLYKPKPASGILVQFFLGMAVTAALHNCHHAVYERALPLYSFIFSFVIYIISRNLRFVIDMNNLIASLEKSFLKLAECSHSLETADPTMDIKKSLGFCTSACSDRSC